MAEFAWDEHSYKVAKMVDEFTASVGRDDAVSQELTDAENVKWLRKLILNLEFMSTAVFDKQDVERFRVIADRLERPGVEVSTCLTVEPMKRGEPVTCRIDAVGFYAEDFERIAGEYPTNGRMVNVTIRPAG